MLAQSRLAGTADVRNPYPGIRRSSRTEQEDQCSDALNASQWRAELPLEWSKIEVGAWSHKP